MIFFIIFLHFKNLIIFPYKQKKHILFMNNS
nr:MAG TPA: hypothetical protein [Caudoviricetes sp.]